MKGDIRMGFNEDNHSNFSDQPNSNQTGWNSGVNNNGNPNQDGWNSGVNNSGNPNQNMNQNPNFNTNNQSYGYNGNGQYNNWNQQTGYQYKPYEEVKKAKREKKPRDPNAKSFAGILAKCAAVALVFGIVGGSIFTGTSYVLHNTFSDSAASSGKSNSNNNAASGKNNSKTSMVESTEKSTQSSSAATDSTSQSAEVSSVVSSAMPSIVAITNMGESQGQDILGQSKTRESESAGSGIIIKQDNTYLYIVTNNHVVENSTTLTVQFIDNSTASATIKGTAADSDLAVIQVPVSGMSQDTLSKVKVATLGSSDALKVGEGAVAIGNALGYGQSVTTGVISALNREVSIQDDTTGETITNNLIQTDAAINPGNSGGALINMKGEVVGINEMKYADTSVEGMGYSIPISTASPIIDNLINRQQVDAANQAYLGISGVNVTDQIASAYNMPKGVYVASVQDGSAALTAGIQQGDIITKFDGKEIKTMEELKSTISYYTVGTEVEVVLQRSDNGKYSEQKVKVTLGTKPQSASK